MAQFLHRLVWVAGLGMATAVAGAAELDLTLGRDSVRGEYIAAVGKPVADNVATLDAGVWYRDDDKRDSDAVLAHLGLLMLGDAGARKANVKAGVGARAVLFDASGGVDGAAITLGGMVSGRVPQLNRIGGRLWIYYAPDVSAFGDLENYFETGASLDYQLIRQAYVVAGYRRLRAGFDSGSTNLESSGFIGLRMVF